MNISSTTLSDDIWACASGDFAFGSGVAQPASVSSASSGINVRQADGMIGVTKHEKCADW